MKNKALSKDYLVYLRVIKLDKFSVFVRFLIQLILITCSSILVIAPIVLQFQKIINIKLNILIPIIFVLFIIWYLIVYKILTNKPKFSVATVKFDASGNLGIVYKKNLIKCNVMTEYTSSNLVISSSGKNLVLKFNKLQGRYQVTIFDSSDFKSEVEKIFDNSDVKRDW